MIAGVLIAAVLATGAASATTAEPAGNAALLIAEAKGLLLNGDDLPADFDAKIRDLAPADRMQVIVFLRRSGMLSGQGWTIDQILAPSTGKGGSE